MSRYPLISRLLAALCLTVLLGAQVFGLVRGYVCDCAGLTEWVVQDHCEGPHGAECHQATATAASNHAENDSPDDRREHTQVRDEVQSRLVQALEAPSLVPLLVVFFGEESTWAGRLAPAAEYVGRDLAAGPPRSVAVARTTILLI